MLEAQQGHFGTSKSYSRLLQVSASKCPIEYVLVSALVCWRRFGRGVDTASGALRIVW